jgi:hypothetical protein
MLDAVLDVDYIGLRIWSGFGPDSDQKRIIKKIYT